MDISQEWRVKFLKGLKWVLVAFLVAWMFSFFTGKDDRRYSSENRDVISFSGHGEVSAVPDIANVSFTLLGEAKTLKEAQSIMAQKENKVLAFLRENNVSEKDFKATYVSFSPKYEYVYSQKVLMPCNQYGCPPTPGGKNVIVGYSASESINVKVRNVDDTGKIIEGLASLEVSDLSGPNFAIDNEDSLKAEARKKAIEDAKEKAKVLAKDLGVRLGKITAFNESGDYYPMPMYEKAMMADGVAGSARAELPKGENLITANVSITYEIR